MCTGTNVFNLIHVLYLGRFFGADTRQHLIFELANQGDLFNELRASDFQMPFAERILGLGLIWTVSPFSYMFQALSPPYHTP